MNALRELAGEVWSHRFVVPPLLFNFVLCLMVHFGSHRVAAVATCVLLASGVLGYFVVLRRDQAREAETNEMATRAEHMLRCAVGISSSPQSQVTAHPEAPLVAPDQFDAMAQAAHEVLGRLVAFDPSKPDYATPGEADIANLLKFCHHWVIRMHAAGYVWHPLSTDAVQVSSHARSGPAAIVGSRT